MILTCTHSGPRLKFAFGPPVQEHPCERPVTELVGELAGGSESAATGLWEEYFERVVSLARSRLHAGLRRAADEEDIAVSVFDSVFGGISAGRFPDLADRNSLWRLLCIVTRRKVIDSVHHERRQKRGGGAVRGESVFGDADEGGGFEQFAADVEAPDFAIHLVEEMDQLFAALGDELRKVAQLRLEGRTLEEIAAEAGCSPRTVQRKLRQVRGLLAADAEPDEADAES
jgi:RNA polymerase sigma factor (sigma-70 family)